MELQNSYFFLKNPYRQETSGDSGAGAGVRLLVFEENLTDYIKIAFPFAAAVNTNCFYKRWYTDSIQVGHNACDVEFHVTEVVDTYFLDVVASGKTTAQVISCLEAVQDRLLNSGTRERYIDIVSYDAVSEYYCNKISPKLNMLERNLRKLLY